MKLPRLRCRLLLARLVPTGRASAATIGVDPSFLRVEPGDGFSIDPGASDA